MHKQTQLHSLKIHFVLEHYFNSFTLIVYYIYITHKRGPKLTSRLFQLESF